MRNWFRNKKQKYKYISNPKFKSNKHNTAEEFLLNVDEENNRDAISDTAEIIKINWKENYKMKKKRKKDSNIHLQNNPGYVIELKNVFKSYPISRNEVTPILKGVDLKIKRGEFVILFGKSGSGKSTLLNIMSGLDRANHGDVIVENTNLPYLSNEELTKFRRRHVAFIFQQYHLLNNITGYENVETGLILQKHKDRKNFNIKKATVKLLCNGGIKTDVEHLRHKYDFLVFPIPVLKDPFHIDREFICFFEQLMKGE